MTAAQYAIIGWNARALSPTEHFQEYWNGTDYRRFRNALYDAYKTNTVYSSINTFSTAHKVDRGMYQFSRPVYNPVSRLVDSYPAKVYGGSIDFEDLSTGAIPVTGTASEQIVPALLEAYKRSNWAGQKGLYVLYGALYGDSFIKIVDDTASRHARMEVVHPGKVKDIRKDVAGNIKWIHIEYVRSDDGKNNYLYGEIIDEESYRTLKDDKPFAYYSDETGKTVDQWDNPYGFVPMVHVLHHDVGQMYGVNSFHSQMAKIDELNDAASLLNDQIRKSVNLIWYFAGVARRADLADSTKSTISAGIDNKDETPAIYGPKDSQPYPMVGNLDLTSAGQNIERMIMELERDMPELSMHRLREGGNLTAPGVKSAYADAIDRYTEAQGVYDSGLVRANKMYLSIAGERGYEGFEAFNLSSYDAGDLEHYISQRPIVTDELSKEQKITALNTAQAPIWLVLEEMGYSQEKIDEVKAYQEQQDEKALMIATNAMSEDDEDDDEATAADKEKEQSGQGNRERIAA